MQMSQMSPYKKMEENDAEARPVTAPNKMDSL